MNVSDIVHLAAMMTATVNKFNWTSHSAISYTITERESHNEHLIGNNGSNTVENDKPGFEEDNFEKKVKSESREYRLPMEIERLYSLRFPSSCKQYKTATVNIVR